MADLEASSILHTAFPSYNYKRARVDAAAEDRLSDLPDCLLHDILSRLRSRQAVQTSALSRRWRHVWRSMPFVDIDQRQFPGSDELGSRQRARFEDFADGMLAFAGTALPLHAFRLHLVDCRGTASERWIRRALGRHPATVHIHSNQSEYSGIVRWPPSHLDMGAAACRLTRLMLSGVTLRDGFGEQLGEQCPVLEGLIIDRCHHEAYFAVASPTLKGLTVICRRSYYSYATLAIAAPRLAALFLIIPFSGTGRSPVVTAPGHQPLPSLVTASIIIHDQDRPSQRANKTKLEFLRSMRGFLAQISDVRSLRLSGFTTTALLDQEYQEFPVFQNLRTLLLHSCDVGAINTQVLLRILEGTPNLESIVLHHCKFSGRPRGKERKTQPKRTYSKQRLPTLFQHKNLGLIEIKFKPDDHTHWKKIFGTKGMQQWWAFKRLCGLVPSTSSDMGGGEGSNATRIRDITVGLGRLPITMRDSVVTTRRVQRTSKKRRVQRRVTETAIPPTLTDSQIAPRANPKDDDVLSTEGEVMRPIVDTTST